MTPEFPLRMIFDDGECRVIDSPEELLEAVDTIDTTRPDSGVWIRDANDATVRLRMHGGFVEFIQT